ncbi:MATE family efflux transporter [Allobaculum stercoricanis]|uniref:MATE family efflux transporter n=1 Tax=Allobaculum stercoricanis TaxID=174709 RepID=UPI000369BDF9|nr:MATE family efflux transporter [Allobaculum stercoricanis]
MEQTKQMTGNKMESMPIRQLVLSMSIPIAISMLIQALYNFVDSVFVANYSDQALLAVSLCYPIQTIIVAFAVGTAAGFNTVLSRSLGAKQKQKADQIVLHGLFLSIVNGLVFALLGWFGSEWFMGLFTQSAQVIAQGVIYLRVCTLMCTCVFIQITYERILQAAGDAMGNMIMQGVGALINIILDPIFIYGWFGFPAMGILGAAVATVTGQVIAMLTGIWIVQKKIHIFDIHPTQFKLSPHLIKEIYQVGIPAILMQSIMSFMSLAMNAVLGVFSEVAISAFNVVSKLQQIVYMIVSGITNALIPITAYNYGAANKQRVLDGIRFSLLIATVVAACGTVLFELFASQFLTLFGHDANMLAIATPALRIVSLSMIFAAITMVLCAAYQAAGKPKDSLVITLIRQIILLLPLVWVFAMTFGIQQCWWAYLVAEGAGLAYALVHWRKLQNNLPDKTKA